MTETRRKLMFQVMDGEVAILPILYLFDRLRRCDEVLKWLTTNNLTGKNFNGYYLQFNNSFLNMSAEILRRIDRDKYRKPILAKKDFLT